MPEQLQLVQLGQVPETRGRWASALSRSIVQWTPNWTWGWGWGLDLGLGFDLGLIFGVGLQSNLDSLWHIPCILYSRRSTRSN